MKCEFAQQWNPVSNIFHFSNYSFKDPLHRIFVSRPSASILYTYTKSSHRDFIYWFAFEKAAKRRIHRKIYSLGIIPGKTIFDYRVARACIEIYVISLAIFLLQIIPPYCIRTVTLSRGIAANMRKRNIFVRSSDSSTAVGDRQTYRRSAVGGRRHDGQRRARQGRYQNTVNRAGHGESVNTGARETNSWLTASALVQAKKI